MWLLNVSKPISLLQKSLESDRSNLRLIEWHEHDIEFRTSRNNTFEHRCCLRFDSPLGSLSPNETCRRQSCIKHTDKSKKAVEKLLESGIILNSKAYVEGSLSSTGSWRFCFPLHEFWEGNDVMTSRCQVVTPAHVNSVLHEASDWFPLLS